MLSKSFTDEDGGRWTVLVDGLDTVLRRFHQVHEFSDAQDCMFRIALGRAREGVRLADGTSIRPGDPLGTLHCWNERLRFSPAGPDLHWAKSMHRRVRRSLEILSLHIEQDPSWAQVQAFRGETVLPEQISEHQQLERIVGHYGFELGRRLGSSRSRLACLPENMLRWGFVRAYNPGALARHSILQGRQQLWLTRKALRRLHRCDSAPEIVDNACVASIQ